MSDGSQAEQRDVRDNRRRHRQQHRDRGTRGAIEQLADFAAALAAGEPASAFSGKLSNSMQRYHGDNITAAKSADTRQRRIDKAIALFRAGQATVTTPAHRHSAIDVEASCGGSFRARSACPRPGSASAKDLTGRPGWRVGVLARAASTFGHQLPGCLNGGSPKCAHLQRESPCRS
jgi:Bacteriocin-protection, YdeI or OmpD-Associated